MTPVTVIDCLCRQRLRDLASCSDTKDVDEPASSSAHTLVHRPLFAVTRIWHVINRALGFIIGAACTVAEIGGYNALRPRTKADAYQLPLLRSCGTSSRHGPQGQ